MDLLRWILLAIGIIVVAVVWYHGRRHRSVHEESLLERARRADPGGDSDSAADPDSAEDAPDPVLEDDLPDFDIDPDEFDHIVDRPAATAESGSGREQPPRPRDEPPRPRDEPPRSRDEPSPPPAAGEEDDEGAPSGSSVGTRDDFLEAWLNETDPADERGGQADAGHAGEPDAADSGGRWNPLQGRLVAAARHRLRQGLRWQREHARERGSRESAPVDESGGGDADDRIVVLYVIAGDAERLSGAALAATFNTLGLEFGRYGIYHRHDASGEPVFSVANIVEPGTFDPDTMADSSTPGVAFFTRLPAPVASTEAFDQMIDAARRLAAELDARLLDADRSTLTRQTEQHLRDDLREYDHLRRRKGS